MCSWRNLDPGDWNMSVFDWRNLHRRNNTNCQRSFSRRICLRMCLHTWSARWRLYWKFSACCRSRNLLAINITKDFWWFSRRSVERDDKGSKRRNLGWVGLLTSAQINFSHCRFALTRRYKSIRSPIEIKERTSWWWSTVLSWKVGFIQKGSCFICIVTITCIKTKNWLDSNNRNHRWYGW